MASLADIVTNVAEVLAELVPRIPDDLLGAGLALDDSILSHDSASMQWACLDARSR